MCFQLLSPPLSKLYCAPDIKLIDVTDVYLYLHCPMLLMLIFAYASLSTSLSIQLYCVLSSHFSFLFSIYSTSLSLFLFQLYGAHDKFMFSHGISILLKAYCIMILFMSIDPSFYLFD